LALQRAVEFGLEPKNRDEIEDLCAAAHMQLLTVGDLAGAVIERQQLGLGRWAVLLPFVRKFPFVRLASIPLRLLFSKKSMHQIRLRFVYQSLSNAYLNFGCVSEMEPYRNSRSLRELLFELGHSLRSLTVPPQNLPNLNLVITELGSDRENITPPRPSSEFQPTLGNGELAAAPGPAKTKCTWREVANVSFDDTGMIFDSTQAFFSDLGLSPSNYFRPGRERYWIPSIDDTSSLIVRRYDGEIQQLKTGILIPSRAPSNWFHWWFEVMHAVLLDEKWLPPEAPLILAHPIPDSFKKIFHRYSDRTLMVLGGEVPPQIEVKNGFVLPPVIQTRDSFEPAHLYTTPLYDDEALRVMRFLILRDKPDRNGPKNVFLTRRSGHRSLSNHRQIEKMCGDSGYTCINPSKLSLDDQVSIMQTAENIITPGGAVMANFLFAKKKTRITQLVAPQNAYFAAPELICGVSESSLITIQGKSRKISSFDNALAWQHAEFAIELNQIRHALSSD
jgi:hypothetical protein